LNESEPLERRKIMEESGGGMHFRVVRMRHWEGRE